jgi:uncharacterized HAD superfamily protein
MAKPLRIGFDFDGVIAYNPARIVRAPVSYFKKKIFKVHKLSFFYPKNSFERWVWTILHDSSLFPAYGVDLLKEMTSSSKIEAHLITARYSFLDKSLYKWLHRYGLTPYFKSITLNSENEQPHLYKQKTIERLKLDYFVEDNLDIVKHLDKTVNAKVYWIYNILDRNYPHPRKHPNVNRVLLEILKKK